MSEIEILLTFVYFLECTVVQCKDALSIYWMLANLKIIYQFHAHSVHQNSVEIFWAEIYRGRLFFRVKSKKSRPQYISAQKISTLFWCTEWAWNWQIIFRFASIHGRACFNRWKEHPYIVLQYTPKSTQK